MTRRDLSREHALLAGAAGSPQDGFVRHAVARLEAGEQVYGDRWARLGVQRLLVELLEEAADLGAWAALAIQAVDLDETLAAAQVERVESAARYAARQGAQAHRVLRRALDAIDRKAVA